MQSRLTSLKRTIFLACALTCAGCNPTTIRSGLPPGDTAQNFDRRWHASLLFGTIAVSGPYDLDALCPEGWSEVTLGSDPFTFLASAVTAFIYSPGRLTIVCAAYGSPGPPPMNGYAPSAGSAKKPSYPPAPPPPSNF